MRVVDSILGRFKRIRREDPVFGSMLYMGDHLKYWEGKANFPSSGSLVEVFVDGSADDSFELQHKFFQQLLQDWPTICERTGELLVEEEQKRNPKEAGRSAWEIFEITSLSIPKSLLDSATWEASFTKLSDRDHIWTVQMYGPRPENVRVDG